MPDLKMSHKDGVDGDGVDGDGDGVDGDGVDGGDGIDGDGQSVLHLLSPTDLQQWLPEQKGLISEILF